VNEIVYLDAGDGETYEDTYSGWLRVFQNIAEGPRGAWSVHSRVPAIDWGAAKILSYYLGGETDTHADHKDFRFTRAEVEHACAQHPLLVDALWRADMRWGNKHFRRHQTEKTFNISTYSGFWRPEILDYMELVRTVHKPKANTIYVMTPCAADKPYPAPLHKAVADVCRALIPPHQAWEVLPVSSAVGPCPQDSWEQMPHYDAGLPFFERVKDTLDAWALPPTSTVYVNYTDMLQQDINQTLEDLGACLYPVFPAIDPRADYLPLMESTFLSRLSFTIEQVVRDRA